MKAETKVGLLFLAAVLMTIGFAYYLGKFNPFSSNYELRIAYNFAGGIEVGSPVRVMGIKVGKVKSIDFEPKLKMPDGEEVKLKIVISVERRAWKTIRQDSKFFINLAGVIGEKFIEISPGSLEKPEFKPGDLVRGEDPPRIDQLISQSYGLAGKVMEFFNQNESSVVDTINTINRLVLNLNKLLKTVDKTSSKKEVLGLMRNLASLTDDLSYWSGKTRSEEGKRTLELIHRLLWRLDDIDERSIRKFLQDEGIKAKIF